MTSIKIYESEYEYDDTYTKDCSFIISLHDDGFINTYQSSDDYEQTKISGPNDDEIKAYSLINKADIKRVKEDYWEEDYYNDSWYISIYARSKPEVDITVDIIGLVEDIPK